MDQFAHLLDLEMEDSRKATTLRMEQYSGEELQRQGLTILSLSAKMLGNSGFTPGTEGGQVVELRSSSLTQKMMVQFVPGDIVLLSRSSPLEKAFSGTLIDASFGGGGFVGKGLFPNLPKDLSRGVWRLDKTENRITYERMLVALKRFTDYDSTYCGIRHLIIGDEPMEPGENKSPIPIPSSCDIRQIMQGLNDSQRAAILKALQSRITLIQGPPGTGKTTTAIGLLMVLSRILPQRKGSILATAFSNVAVDNMVDALFRGGLKVVRVGYGVKRGVAQTSLESWMERHPKFAQVVEVRQKIDSFRGQKTREATRDPELRAAFAALKRRESDLLAEIMDCIHQEADIVCATCIGSVHPFLGRQTFRFVLIDECTQAIEPACIVPITLGAERLVLLGDQQQLPPTIISQRAGDLGLRLSLFERLINRGIVPSLLATQYRMVPILCEFPSKQFYDGRVQSIKREVLRIKRIPWPHKKIPIMFVDVSGKETRTPNGSISNQEECKILCQLVWRMCQTKDGKKPQIAQDHVGVITPYSAQVRLIEKALQREGLRETEVSTVDGYQGREKTVILISTVRSNIRGEVGFLSDRRRLNVSLTRCRDALIVVGNVKTLRNNPDWSAWLDWLVERGLVISESVLWKGQEKTRR